MASEPNKEKIYVCSFCMTEHPYVNLMIISPHDDTGICDSCVAECTKAIVARKEYNPKEKIDAFKK